MSLFATEAYVPPVSSGRLSSSLGAQWLTDREPTGFSGAVRKIAAQFPDAYYCTVDVNKVARLPRQFKIAKMPTFIFLRAGETLETYVGAAEAPAVAAALAARVQQHAAPSATAAGPP